MTNTVAGNNRFFKINFDNGNLTRVGGSEQKTNRCKKSVYFDAFHRMFFSVEHQYSAVLYIGPEREYIIFFVTITLDSAQKSASQRETFPYGDCFLLAWGY